MWPLATNRGCFDTGAPQDRAMKERFLKHCERTMIFYGDYSGAEFAREAMQRVIEGFEKMEDKSFPHNPFRFVRPFIIIIIIIIILIIIIIVISTHHSLYSSS